MADDDVPPEFAETYRAAYRKALDAPAGSSRRGHRRAEDASLVPWWSLGWVRALAAAVAASVLVAGAYLLGRAFTGPGSVGRTTSAVPPNTAGSAYAGPVRSIRVVHAAASCTGTTCRRRRCAPVDLRRRTPGGRRSQQRLAVRGSRRGRAAHLRAAGRRPVAEVGLVPGYAKTDPVTGADRYAEENRITEVRWVLGRRTVVQRFSADPRDRSMRLLRIPVTAARRLQVTILATVEGSRNSLRSARFGWLVPETDRDTDADTATGKCPATVPGYGSS